MREAKSYCRICGALCGTRLKIDDEDRIVEVRGDKDHPLSRGYACVKGVQSSDLYYGPGRLLHPLKRRPDGGFDRIPLEQALDEIAEKIATSLDRDGPEATAGFRGTPNNMDAAGYHFLPAWMAAIGSPSFYSTITIDQSAKAVTAERLGMWAGGKQEFQDADVWVFAGINPVVSNWGGFGGVWPNPVLNLKEAQARGVKMIVIDPRRTETAHYADIHLQPRPGEDPTLAAGLLRMILDEGWHDAEFCDRYVEGLDAFRHALDPFTPAYVAARAGVPETELREAAHLFAKASRRGTVITGTGPDMAARSNLAEHLYECLNVICGRYLREGEVVRSQSLLAGRRPLHAEVIAPGRSWEKGYRSRLHGYGTLRGEMMSGTMADEILTPGAGQIRNLIVVSGNPAGAFPDQVKTVRALSSLDLLVTIDPFMSETAKLAHYILPPKLPYERPDAPLAFPMPFVEAFAQYTPAVVPPPAGSDVVEDWYVFWGLASRLGRSLVVGGAEIDRNVPPSVEEVLEILARNGVVSLDEVKAHPSGRIFPVEEQRVEPARPGASGRFQVAPADVVAELAEVAADFEQASGQAYPYRLVSRRMREVMNTTYRDLPSTRRRYTFNPAYMHPDDMAAEGLSSGDHVRISSDHGSIPAIVRPDDAVRSGVVSMSHGWGDLPSNDPDYQTQGSSTSLLISTDRDIEPINAMPRMSAIPVHVHKASVAAE